MFTCNITICNNDAAIKINGRYNEEEEEEAVIRLYFHIVNNRILCTLMKHFHFSVDLMLAFSSNNIPWEK